MDSKVTLINDSPSLPSQKKIAEYWFENEGKKLFLARTGVFPINRHCCFACGNPNKLEKAHIKARRHGGSSDVWNLHLLCPACHIESEDFSLEEKKYWAWLRSKFLRDYREPQQWLVRELELMGLTLSELLILYLSGKKDEALQKVESALSKNHRKRYERLFDLLTKKLANPLFKDIRRLSLSEAESENLIGILEPMLRQNYFSSYDDDEWD